MPEQQPMRDLIVLIPGILGSVLVKDGQEVWGASAQSVIGNLVTFGRAPKELKLEPGIGHEDPKDEQLLGILRDYWRRGRPVHWLFPGRNPSRPITKRALQLACR